MFENLELTCHLTSFHDEFIVTPSGWKPPDAASVCRESTQILQNCETCSRSAQAPLTLKVNPLLISACSLNTNIRCHIFRPIRCEKHVVWQPALSLCAIPFNGIPPLVRCVPRSANPGRQTKSLPNIRCSRNGSLDNDDTDESLLLLSLHKRNQQIRHRSHTPIFLFSLSVVDRKSVRIYCAQPRSSVAQRRLFSVS